MKNKITFVDNSVLVNGDEVARMSGRGEVYITMKNVDGDFKVVARFKYKSPKAGAKHWLKFILNHYTSVQIIEKLERVVGQMSETPLGLASKLGYVSLNELNAKKILAAREALRNHPFTIVNYV